MTTSNEYHYWITNNLQISPPPTISNWTLRVTPAWPVTVSVLGGAWVLSHYPGHLRMCGSFLVAWTGRKLLPTGQGWGWGGGEVGQRGHPSVKVKIRSLKQLLTWGRVQLFMNSQCWLELHTSKSVFPHFRNGPYILFSYLCGWVWGTVHRKNSFFPQLYWELIDTHHCTGLRYTALRFDLHIFWNDCHNRFNVHYLI